MTFPTGCPTCDTLGPELPGAADLLNFHRALHGLWFAFTEPLARLLRKAIR